MDIKELEAKWPLLDNLSQHRNPSIRINSECQPDLFIGLYNNSGRCLILKLPVNHHIDFQKVEKTNLSIELFAEQGWIILKLLDDRFKDLFNNLILSLYNKICRKSNATEYGNEFVQIFHKWSEFFDDNDSSQLSGEAVKGLFGELIVLNECIKETSSTEINNLLNCWKGPYNNRHDFEMQQLCIEVKTKDITAIDIKISSEYQLQEMEGKLLELAVVSLAEDNSGLSLKKLIDITRELVSSKLGDFTIVLRALSRIGLTPINISDYNHLTYEPQIIQYYNCCTKDFPRIIWSEVPRALNHIQYQLVLAELDNFIIRSKIFTVDGD